jgi:hypothetical protein
VEGIGGCSGGYRRVHVKELPCTVYCTRGYRRGVVEGRGGCSGGYWRGVLEGIGGACQRAAMYCKLYAKLTFGPGCQAVARKAECFGKHTGTRVPTNGMASFCVIAGIPKSCEIQLILIILMTF